MDPYTIYNVPSNIREDLITLDEILAGAPENVFGSLDVNTRMNFARTRLENVARDLDNLFAVVKQQLH